jgi:hypothetical protein
MDYEHQRWPDGLEGTHSSVYSGLKSTRADFSQDRLLLCEALAYTVQSHSDPYPLLGFR